MKRTKVWSAVLSVLCAATLLHMTQPAQAAIQPRFEYGVRDEGVEIFGLDSSTVRDVTIPSVLNGYPVVAIAESGFSCLWDLTSVVISEGIRIVDDYAFSDCSGLTSVTLPDSLQELGSGSFTECPELEFTVYKNGKYLGNAENPHLALVAPVAGAETVTVHKNTKVIGQSFAYMENVKLKVETGNACFSADNAGVLYSADKAVLYWAPKDLSGSYTVPEGVEEICERAFTSCHGMTDVTLPDSVKSIADYAFAECAGLQTVTLGSQLEYVGEYAFNYCDALQYNICENGKYLGSEENPCLLLVKPEDTAATVFSFEEGVQVIASGAFSNCHALTELTVPDGVVGIGNNVFRSCAALTKLHLGKDVRRMGSEMFLACDNLTQITADSGNQVYSSHAGVLFNKDKTVLIQAPVGMTGAYTLPDSVTRIEREAFSLCKKLTGIHFGAGLREIGKNAFYCCEQLQEVTIPGSVQAIGEASFRECIGLTRLTLGEGVTAVGRKAFESCSALTEAILPESLTEIGESAFCACKKLTQVTIPANVSWIGNYAFSECSGMTAIHVAQDNPQYKSTDGVLYNKAMTRLIQAPGGIPQCVVPEGVQVIGEYAFSGCKKLEYVILPEGVTTIETAAFFDTGLRGLLIPASVTQVEGYAFDATILNVRFLGDAPEVFGQREAIVVRGAYGSRVVFYPADNATWTGDAKDRICRSARWETCGELEVTQGADTVITPERLSVTVATEANARYFMGLYLDGVWVAPENYTLTGDTEVTIQEAYLAGLRSGTHQLTLAFISAQATTTLTVRKDTVGDLDGVNDVNEDDAIYLLQHVLMPGQFPINQDVDFDGNGRVNEDDAIYLLQHILMPGQFPL